MVIQDLGDGFGKRVRKQYNLQSVRAWCFVCVRVVNRSRLKVTSAGSRWPEVKSRRAVTQGSRPGTTNDERNCSSRSHSIE
jgi:hypothetical protein